MIKALKKWYKRYKKNRYYKSLLGPVIASGFSRTVYVVKGDPMRVIKVQQSNTYYGDHANILEWSIWGAVEDTKYEKSFARCYEMSECGKYLIQERVGGVGSVNVKKIKTPEFVGDIHANNIGVRDGKPVLVDYASLKIKGKNNSW